MTPDQQRSSSGGRRPVSPEFAAEAREYVRRLSEGGDLWQQAVDRDRERRERLEEVTRHEMEMERFWTAEYERLTRGGPIRRMLRALFT
jgi:hypothetical protein